MVFMDEEQQLEQAIAALEGQRALLGDGVVDAALAPIREKLRSLRAAGDQQLKFVSVLFTDVVGSTRMIQSLDPEEISGIIDGAMRRFAAAIERHGGAVRNFMGDGLLALFGFPAAQEDDAERAIRAGLAMLDEARAYAGEVETTWGFPGFAIRVGINTGQVILGGGVDRDTNALGFTTSIAARMQAAAPPGGLLITHDTYLQVRGVFDVEPQPPLQVKGKDEPLQTYVVLGAKARAFRLPTRGVEDIETHMIGRDAELRRLQDGFRAAMEDGEGQIVTVVGEPGVGKSRLIYEFDSWLELLPEQVFYFRARAQAATQNLAYSLLRDLFSFRFGIRDSDLAAVVRDLLERGLAEGIGSAAVSAADTAGRRGARERRRLGGRHDACTGCRRDAGAPCVRCRRGAPHRPLARLRPG